MTDGRDQPASPPQGNAPKPVLRLGRNVLIVVALLSAVTAVVMLVMPTATNSVSLQNRSGGAVENVMVSVRGLTSDFDESKSASRLDDGQSLLLEHPLDAASLMLSFEIAGQHYNRSLPSVAFGKTNAVSYQINPDGTVNLVK